MSMLVHTEMEGEPQIAENPFTEDIQPALVESGRSAILNHFLFCIFLLWLIDWIGTLAESGDPSDPLCAPAVEAAAATEEGSPSDVNDEDEEDEVEEDDEGGRPPAEVAEGVMGPPRAFWTKSIREQLTVPNSCPPLLTCRKP